MKNKRKWIGYTLWFIGSIILLMLIFIAGKTIYYRIAEKKAVVIARDYLWKKYGEKMTFENVSHSGFDTFTYRADFIPPDKFPAVTVELSPDLVVYGDDYYLNRLAEKREKNLSEEVGRLWRNHAGISVMYRNTEDHVGYSAVITAEDKSSLEESSVRLYEMILRIKKEKFRPDSLVYEYLAPDNRGHSIRIDNPEQIKSAGEILEKLKNGSMEVKPDAGTEKIVEAAETYLKETYGQGMKYCYTEYSWCRPDQYVVGFVSEKEPGTVIQVDVRGNEAVLYPIRKWNDNYRIRQFEVSMKQQLTSEGQKIWKKDAYISVSVGDTDWEDVNFATEELGETAALQEQEKMLSGTQHGYALYITDMGTGTKEETASRIYRTIELIKKKGYQPKTIHYEHISVDDGMQTTELKDWMEITSEKQLYEKMTG